jgi:hypothetical protein
MIQKLVLILLFLFFSHNSVLSLKCYINAIPFILNYSVTIDTLPSFDNNSLVDVSGECTLTLMWFRNPSSSMIIFGYEKMVDENNNSSVDSILASVQYQLEGEDPFKRLSHDVQLKCQSSDGCNNPNNLKKLLKSLEINEHFSGQFDNLLASNSSFDNESINNCYFNLNSSGQCPPIDYINCQRCEISVRYLPLSLIDICATCPRITKDENFLVRDKIFVLNNRSEIVDRIQLLCQRGEHCNSIENINQIREFSLINFDFDKYFSSSSSSHAFNSFHIFIFIILILF